jgi:hypothetical protein
MPFEPGFPLSISGPTDKILFTAAPRNFELSLQCKVLSRATEGAIRTSREDPKVSDGERTEQAILSVVGKRLMYRTRLGTCR